MAINRPAISPWAGAMLALPLWLALGREVLDQSFVSGLALLPAIFVPALIWTPRTWHRDPSEYRHLGRINVISVAVGVPLQLATAAMIGNGWDRSAPHSVPAVGAVAAATIGVAVASNREKAYLRAGQLAGWTIGAGIPAIAIGAVVAASPIVNSIIGCATLLLLLLAAGMLETCFPDQRLDAVGRS